MDKDGGDGGGGDSGDDDGGEGRWGGGGRRWKRRRSTSSNVRKLLAHYMCINNYPLHPAGAVALNLHLCLREVRHTFENWWFALQTMAPWADIAYPSGPK